VEEVGRQDRLGLGLQERLPGEPGPRGRGVDARVLEGPPDCRWREQAQLAELAAGQQPGQRGQDSPVGPGQLRGLDLALEHRDLMAQDQDLGVLGTVRPGEQGQPAEHAQHHQVRESH
jgi:hypothetical protein